MERQEPSITKYHEEFEWLSVIAENTEETYLGVKKLLEFMSGQSLQEYEDKREEEIKHNQLIQAIEGIESTDSIEAEKKGKGIFAAFAPLKKLFAFLVGPAMLKIAAVAAGIFTIFKVFSGDNLKQITESITKAWSENILPSLNKLRDAFNILKDSKIGEFISDIFTRIPQFFTDMLSGAIDNLGDFISGVMDGIGQIFTGDLSGFLTIFKTAWSFIFNQFDVLISGVLKLFSLDNFFAEDGSFLSFVKRSIFDMFDNIRQGFNNIIDGIKNFFTEAKDGLVSAFVEAIDNIVSIFNAAKEGVSNFFNNIKTTIVELITNTIDSVKAVFDETKDKFLSVFNEVREFLTRFSPSSIMESFSETVEGVKAFFDRIRERFQNMIPSWLRKDEDGEMNVMENVRDSIDTARDNVGQFFSNLNPLNRSQIEPIQNPSALVTGTATALSLRELEDQIQNSNNNPAINQQINLSGGSSSNIVMPQYSPNGHVESAQDLYGAPSY